MFLHGDTYIIFKNEKGDTLFANAYNGNSLDSCVTSKGHKCLWDPTQWLANGPVKKIAPRFLNKKFKVEYKPEEFPHPFINSKEISGVWVYELRLLK